MKRIILDLCGGTGSWSRPYAEAGYDVRIVTLPEEDVRLYRPPGDVHGILAAPPCTMFCRMRMCRGRPSDLQFIEALSVVDACLRLILLCRNRNLNWWALENSQGYLKEWLGEPQFKFDPCDFGDPWTKRTWLWGFFTKPTGIAVEPIKGSWIKKHSNILSERSGFKQPVIARTPEEQSSTPPGFTRAFFEANP